MTKNLPAMQEAQEMWVQSLGQEDPLEEEVATIPVSLARKFHVQTVWWATVHVVCKESDTTEAT